MPPILPICMSTMTRSGGSAATAFKTSGPEEACRTAISLLSRSDASVRRTAYVSLATRTVGTIISSRQAGQGNGRRQLPPRLSECVWGWLPLSLRSDRPGDWAPEQVISEPPERIEIVNVEIEERDGDERRVDPAGEG